MYIFQHICKLNDIFAHFHIFINICAIFMHTVDFKSDTYTCVIFEIFHVKYTDFSSILYLTSYSVDSKIKSHVLHTFVNLTSYVYIFQHICKLNDIFAPFLIFINICAIFMHNVDFNSDPYTLCNIWNLTLLSTKILDQSLLGQIFSS